GCWAGFGMGWGVTREGGPTVADTRPTTCKPPRPRGVTSKAASRRGRAASPASLAMATRTPSAATSSRCRPPSGTSLAANGTLHGRSDARSDFRSGRDPRLVIAAVLGAFFGNAGERFPTISGKAVDRIPDILDLVKSGRSHPCHDHAIQSRNARVLWSAAKQAIYHRVSSAARGWN